MTNKKDDMRKSKTDLYPEADEKIRTIQPQAANTRKGIVLLL